MKHKIIWLIAVFLLGLSIFVKANPTNPTVIKINSLLGRNQQLILTGVTDTGETLPTDITGAVIPSTPEVVPTPTNHDPVVMCTMEYFPVCAEVQVQCIRAPCPPLRQTFPNRCQMNANKLAKFLYKGACKEDTPVETTPTVETKPTGLANPASVNCEKNGGTLSIITAADGSQSGICTFANGKQCEEWAFMLGECSK